MKILQKKNLKYLFFLTTFVLTILLGKEFIFNQAQGSTSTIIATVNVNPLSIEARAIPKSVFVERDFQVRARIENKGTNTLNDVMATVYLPSGLVLLSDQNQYLGEIEGGAKEMAYWQAKGQVAGVYIITISVSGIDTSTNELITSEASTKVVVKDKPRGGLSTLFDFFLGIFSQ